VGAGLVSVDPIFPEESSDDGTTLVHILEGQFLVANPHLDKDLEHSWRFTTKLFLGCPNAVEHLVGDEEG